MIMVKDPYHSLLCNFLFDNFLEKGNYYPFCFKKRIFHCTFDCAWYKENNETCNHCLAVSKLSEGVVAQWCNPLTLKPKQSGGVVSRRGRASPLERHDKGLRTRGR